MAEPSAASSRAGTFERLQERSNSIRRARPPNITIVKDEARVPLRSPKPKRESKVGLRNIFSRSKMEKDDKSAEGSSSLREPRSGGIRASLAEIGHWSYKLHSARSEGSLLSPTSNASKSPPVPDKAAQRAAIWNPPPLFQVYPQAVKYATLPACNAPLEVLARLNEARNNASLQDDPTQSSPAPDQISEHGAEKKGESGKKKHRIGTVKASLDWTDKIFVLVTSGYLLQYAGEGAFNRVPEKILQLTKDSAAYASDLIPGRHWVLQVASSADADGNTSADPKSLRSKLSLRPNEKRHVSNMLLVFEGPEAMDGWLATLRREIQLLGGKKKRSETGILDADEIESKLRTQASQRTLVVRDPARFSRIISQDFSYTQENALVPPTEDEFAATGENRTSQSTLDDGSTSTSMISSDGIRLDSLRDSGNGVGNRLSFGSSGQRTIGSSPACSPTRASFSSHGEDPLSLPSMSEVRLRPNAAAILNRRQSMRNMIPNLEIHVGADTRPQSIVSTSSAHEDGQQYVLSPPSVPNFSVPHLASKRFSSSNLSLSLDPVADPPQTPEHKGPKKLIRRLPPTARPESRPLSIVVDQPSPNFSRPPNFRSLSSSHKPTWEAAGSPYTTKPRIGSPSTLHFPKRSPRPVPEEVGITAQTNANRGRTSGRPCDTPELEEFEAPERIPRSASSLSGNIRSFSTTPTLRHPPYKRSTFLAERSFSRSSRYSFTRRSEWDLPKIREPGLPPSPTCSPKRSVPSLRAFPRSSSSQLLGVDNQFKALMSRRSMPQLAEGPPPAPPPNCALPPIPGNPSTKVQGIRT